MNPYAPGLLIDCPRRDCQATPGRPCYLHPATHRQMLHQARVNAAAAGAGGGQLAMLADREGQS